MKVSILPVACLVTLLATWSDGFTLGPSNSRILKPQLTTRSSPTLRQHEAVVAKNTHPLVSLRPSKSCSSHALQMTTMIVAEAVNTVGFLQNSDVWVFLAGVFPFAWATVEFWRRIAVGEPFGTGSNQVIIGMDNSPADSRGRQVLGRGAIITAYILFAVAFGTLAIVLYSVISSGSAPEILPPSQQMQLSQEVISSGILEN